MADSEKRVQTYEIIFSKNKRAIIDFIQGDSGGPIVCNFQGRESFLTGVVSFGPDGFCGSMDMPGVYTKISSYKKYINEFFKQHPNLNYVVT